LYSGLFQESVDLAEELTGIERLGLAPGRIVHPAEPMPDLCSDFHKPPSASWSGMSPIPS
jgi:hypothetical protein